MIITNKHRAIWASEAVYAFERICGMQGEGDLAKVQALVTDLIHYLRLHSKLHFDEAVMIVNMAVNQAEEETNDDPDEI